MIKYEQWCPVPNSLEMNDPINLYRVWVNEQGKKRPLNVLAFDSCEAEAKAERMGHTIYRHETRLDTLHHAEFGYSAVYGEWIEMPPF